MVVRVGGKVSCVCRGVKGGGGYCLIMNKIFLGKILVGSRDLLLVKKNKNVVYLFYWLESKIRLFLSVLRFLDERCF